MISLGQLIASVPAAELMPGTNNSLQVQGLTCDSRKAGPGLVFVALKGEKIDGHRYIPEAIARGCIAAVVEEEEDLPKNIPVIRVADSHQAYGLMAAEYYGHPAKGMKIIGLTGTNGKTTTSWIIEKIIQTAGGSPGVIGTVNYRYREEGGTTVELDAPLTTPEPMQLQGLLRRMNDGGVTHVILEVSSHSLSQQRLAGILFDVAVFTNLSRDHLDYHKNMMEYFLAKRRLFDEYLKSKGTAVIGLTKDVQAEKDGYDWGEELVHHLDEKGFMAYSPKSGKQTYMTCGFDKKCTVCATEIHQDRDGLDCMIVVEKEKLHVHSGLIGLHNISNMVMATGVCKAINVPGKKILKGLQEFERIPGRLERVMLGGRVGGPVVFVDYAHTPDALENVLRTLRQVTPGRLFCVFGCGGDRDKGKRPVMGSVAGELADAVILTSDNPRTEIPETILSEIEKGLAATGLRKVEPDRLFSRKKAGGAYTVIEDRRCAIQKACSRTEEDDVVLIAGKGHETYQIIGTEKRFFDDRVEARNGFLRWKLDHLLAATSGRLIQRGENILFRSISTDTRTLAKGDVFVALKGENFDGHEYVKTAIKKGAAAVITHKDCPGLSNKKVVLIQVADTLTALGDLAGYRRRLLGTDVKVIGITGSSGKTTVKEMTASIFEEQYAKTPGKAVLKTIGNLNNLIGLPLSLLQIDGGHRVGVMEMGMNRPGEIERLTRIAGPDIGCITNIQAAHLEGLGSIEGVAKAKGELFSAMSGSSIKIINYDDHHARKLGETYGNNTVTYAVTPVGRRFNPDVRATRIVSLGEAGMRFTLQIKSWRKRVTIPAAGMHNVANCSAAAAIATAAGVTPEVILQGLVRYRHGDKRLQIVDLPGGIHVVNDSYNANPASMAAALKTVSGFGKKCSRIALLGDMFELGQSAAQAHREIGELVAELDFDFLGVTGEHSATLADAAASSGMKRSQIKVCRDKEQLVARIVELIAGKQIRPGDWILIKGSRGMRMEKVLQALTQKLTPEKN